MRYIDTVHRDPRSALTERCGEYVCVIISGVDLKVISACSLASTPHLFCSNMRLLNARTLQLTEFASDFPPYAILSHTWSSEEVSFQEIHSSEARYKLGYQKIQKCCEQALVDDLEYVWVDTCCIDKSSSAELSEAINSMFQWYKSARVCYVHLADVEGPYRKNARTTLLTYAPDGNPSRWYTRGWTLQELLAPSNVVFYNREWQWIGTKRQLLEEVSGITGVDEINLIGLGIKPTCIGQKMSWAASRKTTRIEDKAYCLLGLCGVHMPLLYGEGENAFRRLQEEIIRTSTDMSILAWGGCDNRWGILASSPGSFINFPYIPNPTRRRQLPYEMTNAGLRITLPLISIHVPRGHKPVSSRSCRFNGSNHPDEEQYMLAVLDCVTIAGNQENPIVAGILLQQSDSGERFYRASEHSCLYVEVKEMMAQMKEMEVLIACEAAYADRRWFIEIPHASTAGSAHLVIRPSCSVQNVMHFYPDCDCWGPLFPGYWHCETIGVEDGFALAEYHFTALELLCEELRCVIIFGKVLHQVLCGITLGSSLAYVMQEGPMRNVSYNNILERGTDNVWVPWAVAYSKLYHQYIDYLIQALTAVIKLEEHTVTDRGTYLTLSNTDKDLADQLEIYKRGDEYEELLNPADIITSKDSDNKELVQDFVQWVLSGDGQDVIANFQKEDRYCLYKGFPTEDSEDVEASDELS
ncbi:heterokaryon incompatibility protein-domain-containing protein [Aspergillus arachidicola]|uniref:Heterokaryon incompatibility protein-domain-containing protein n=1 Tax=Aspergillus arachidicola TaxID=656916 RepID=A0A5N6YI40_9EURO|nr:heterokaryon incompatibility protein-domain-containing protein [Aspergillus arachidicola]